MPAPALDSQTENAIALDYASGLPSIAIMARHGLPSERVLTEVLERPRVEQRIQGHLQSMHEVGARMIRKKEMSSDEIMDVLLRRARNIEDPRQHTIGMWVIDSVAPTAQPMPDPTAGAEVICRFINAVDRFAELTAGRRPPAELPATCSHLHSGKEFISRRDKAIAGIAVTRD